MHVVRAGPMNFFDTRILEIGGILGEERMNKKSTKQQQQQDDNECNSTNGTATACAGQPFGSGGNAGNFAATAVIQLQELTTNNNELSSDDVEMVGGAVVETTKAILGSFRRLTDPNTTADVVIGGSEILGKASQFGALGGPAGAIAGSIIGSLCALTGALVGAAIETQADPETPNQFLQRHLEERSMNKPSIN